MQNKDLEKSLAVTNNDNMLTIYLSSLVRAILALDNLIDNKLKNSALAKEEVPPHVPRAARGPAPHHRNQRKPRVSRETTRRTPGRRSKRPRKRPR